MMKAQGGGGLFDSQIEYLESTGTQYIDLGMSVASSFLAEYKAQFTQQTASMQCLAGSRFSSRNSGIICALAATGGKLYCSVGDYTQVVQSNLAQTDLHEFKTSLSDTTQMFEVDGVGATGNINTGRISYTNICLFALNWNGAQSFASAKLYNFKLTKNNVLALDMIPVRVGMVGYMYDRVSGQLFGNDGTGDFVLGPDII